MNIETQSPKCVITDFLGCLACTGCGKDFVPERMDQVNCSKRCANHVAHLKRDEQRAEAKELKAHVQGIAFAYLNRDRYIGFDGRYEGPLNQPITIVAKIRKDHGYHPMPRNVHIEPVAAKFHTVTPEDVDWATKQKSFGHSQSMPRPFNTFCAVCVEMVIDKSERSVRVTKGVYLPIEHKCGSVRVYDLRGNLLETKQL